jgi:LysR family hydrogen peroxide-inducible transcriptional activator
MNIQQLEYLIAVDNHRHFAKAAEQCFVTQPTLSTMIQRLEEELEIKIFDRTKHPIEPTETGIKIIRQAKISLQCLNRIKEIANNEQNTVSGVFQLGVIPTVASYLVPEILAKKQKKYPELELVIKEITTKNIFEQVKNGLLDGAVLAGPINSEYFEEFPVYYEKFYAYVSRLDKLFSQKEIDLQSLNINDLWLLEEEHCLRGQIERLCGLKRKNIETSGVRFESGSIDTLLHVVDVNSGITIIPEMHAMGLSEEKQDNLRPLKNTTAVREITVIVNKNYSRKAVLKVILEIIKNSVPKLMRDPKLKEFVVEL